MRPQPSCRHNPSGVTAGLQCPRSCRRNREGTERAGARINEIDVGEIAARVAQLRMFERAKL